MMTAVASAVEAAARQASDPWFNFYTTRAARRLDSPRPLGYRSRSP
jgi:hypothetical protein